MGPRHPVTCQCYACKLNDWWRSHPTVLAASTQTKLVANFERNVALASPSSPEVWDEIFDSIAASERIDSAIRYGRI